MIALGEVVIIGGGCYGSFYAGQLARARGAGAVSWRRLVVVDRDPACAAAALVTDVPQADLVVSDWDGFLEEWLGAERAPDDQVVPSPLMPHLMAEWLARRAAAQWPEHEVGMVPATAALETPFDWLHPGDGVRYVSWADWLCPVHCIEPATCPATGAPRTWEMEDTVAAWTAARAAERRTVGPALFACRHVVYGVGMYPAETASRAFEALAAALDGSPTGADLVVGSISACHGAVGVLRVQVRSGASGEGP